MGITCIVEWRFLLKKPDPLSDRIKCSLAVVRRFPFASIPSPSLHIAASGGIMNQQVSPPNLTYKGETPPWEFMTGLPFIPITGEYHTELKAKAASSMNATSVGSNAILS
jgi:hypothetical protein